MSHSASDAVHHTPAELALMLDTGNEQLAHQAYNELRDLYKSSPAQYKATVNAIYKQDKAGVGFDLIPGDEKGCFRLVDSAKDPTGLDPLYMGGCEWGKKPAGDASATGGALPAASTPDAPGGQSGSGGASSAGDAAAIAGVAIAAGMGATAMEPMDEFDRWIAGTRSTEAPPNAGDWLDKKFALLSHSGDGVTRADLLEASKTGRFADGTLLSRQDMLAVKNVLGNFDDMANANTWFFSDTTISRGDVQKLKPSGAR